MVADHPAPELPKPEKLALLSRMDTSQSAPLPSARPLTVKVNLARALESFVATDCDGI